MKDKFTESVWNKDIDPIIKRTSKTPGSIQAIVNELRKRTKKEWHYSNIRLILDADPKKRTHPSYGLGKTLLEVGEEVLAAMEKSSKKS